MKFTNYGLTLPNHAPWVQSMYWLGCHVIRFSATVNSTSRLRHAITQYGQRHFRSQLNGCFDKTWWTSFVIQGPGLQFVNWQGFSKWLPIRRRRCFQPIRCKVWKLSLINMDDSNPASRSSIHHAVRRLTSKSREISSREILIWLHPIEQLEHFWTIPWFQYIYLQLCDFILFINVNNFQQFSILLAVFVLIESISTASNL